MRFVISLILDRYNGHDFDTAKVNVAIEAASAREAIEAAKFKTQSAAPTWTVQHSTGVHSPDSGPYPPGWKDSGME